jgi:tetratricopeptide (TPR) repeat protein
VAVSNGYHLWTRSFDKELKDIFVIQDEIAKSIAETLLESITPVQQSALKTTSSSDVTAYDYYLRGRQFINRFHKIDIEFARQMFRQAIDLDPDFALAWAGYADCFSLLIMYEDPVGSYREEARKASKRALELDPDLAEAHASRGLALLISEEFEAAETEFNEAIELDPRLFQAYYYFGRARFHQGNLEMAAELFRKAAEVEPADYQSRCLRVQILRGTGRIDEAVTQARDAVRVVENHLKWNPDDARALHLGAGSLIVLGEEERAKSWLKRALEMNPDDSVLLYNVACNFATLGEVDEAIDFLARAIEHGMASAAWMRNDADLKPLHDDARFQALLKQLEEKGAATGA